MKRLALYLASILIIISLLSGCTGYSGGGQRRTPKRTLAPVETRTSSNTPIVVVPKSSIKVVVTAAPTPSPSLVPTAKPTLKPTAKPTPKPTPVSSFSVTVKFSSAKLIYNDHVGNEWWSGVEVNGKSLARGKSIKLKVKSTDTIGITCSAGEDDSIPDDGYEYLEIKASKLKKGKNTYTVDVYVTENRGRYSGNSALWRFTFLVTR